jgi:heme o synthase
MIGDGGLGLRGPPDPSRTPQVAHDTPASAATNLRQSQMQSIHPATSGGIQKAAPVARDWAEVARDLLQLTKPRVTSLVLITSACGALAAPGPFSWSTFSFGMIGVLLVVGAANAFNMYLERDTDGAMQRTRLRPLPGGRLSPELALCFAAVLAVVGLACVLAFVNAVAALLSALALASYVLVYTPLKRVTPWALHVGAVPGAIPPLIGWASVTGTLDAGALSLFLILFVWQLPHFLAIAIFRESEYAKAGLRVLPAVKGLRATKREIAAYSALLLAVSLLPIWTNGAGVAYALVAVLSGVLFGALGFYGLRDDAGTPWARRLFFASMPYLVVVFAALVAAV